jgi:acetolactate synthase-1/3 small subunit
MQIVDIYRAKIVDVAIDSLMIEVTGPEEKIDSLVNLLRGFGIKEMVRTGRVAMMRGAAGSVRPPDEEPDARARTNHRVPRHAIVEQ